MDINIDEVNIEASAREASAREDSDIELICLFDVPLANTRWSVTGVFFVTSIEMISMALFSSRSFMIFFKRFIIY